MKQLMIIAMSFGLAGCFTLPVYDNCGNTAAAERIRAERALIQAEIDLERGYTVHKTRTPYQCVKHRGINGESYNATCYQQTETPVGLDIETLQKRVDNAKIRYTAAVSAHKEALSICKD